MPAHVANSFAWASRGAAIALALATCGCQQKMADQPSYRPDQPCTFFADGTSSRLPVKGTVARGHLEVDAALFTGRIPPAGAGETAAAANRPARATSSGGDEPLLAAEAARFEGLVDEFPLPVTAEVVRHGRDRYTIYCAVCHDAAGTGRGKIVERGYTPPPSYHIERLRLAPVGYFFRVATEGYGSMPSYSAQIPPRDRWAIVAYIRALQLSRRFPVDDLPDDLRRELSEPKRVAARAGGGP